MEAVTTNRSWLIEKLKEDIVKVVFTKTDGTERTMKCTLNQSFLPPPMPTEVKAKPARAVNEEVINAWDIEAEGWRSFRLDSIISVTVENQ